MSGSIPDYTPHFAVVGGPAPHPAGDGRMGVVLVASKALKAFDLEEILLNEDFRRWMEPPEYLTVWHVKLDHRVKIGFQYHVIWAEHYKEAWESLFSIWGEDIVPDNQQQLEHDQRKAIG